MADEAPFGTPEEVVAAFGEREYVADRSIAMASYLSLKLGKPLLVEGEPGCGKTDIARVLSVALDTDLIRLQCYEGLDALATLYEWNYPKQLLAIRMQEKQKEPADLEAEIFGEKFLLRRPLLLWVNPYAERPDFQPEVAGMKRALPYVDLLVPPSAFGAPQAFRRWFGTTRSPMLRRRSRQGLPSASAGSPAA